MNTPYKKTFFYKALNDSEFELIYEPPTFRKIDYSDCGFNELKISEFPKNFKTLYAIANAYFPLYLIEGILIEKLIIKASLIHNDENLEILIAFENSGCQIELISKDDDNWYKKESRMLKIRNIINNI